MNNLKRDVGSSARKDRAFYLMKLEVVAIQLTSGPNKLPIRTLKPIFKTTPVNSAFNGSDLVVNLIKKLQTERKEAVHVASQLYKYGYLYPVEQSVSSFKDDSTLYRMQSEHLWPSQCNNPSNKEYSTFLEKKLLLKVKLTEHEQEVYERFRVVYAKDWAAMNQRARELILNEEICSKEDRNILQGEERAFWRLHRPPPGEPLVMDSSIQKRNINIFDMTDFQIVQDLEVKLSLLKRSNRRAHVTISHSVELLIQNIDKLKCHDPFLKKSIYNPWANDFKTTIPVNPNRFQLWSQSFDLLLRDNFGRELFMKFLSSEVSSENLRFCEEVNSYKVLPASKLKNTAERIFHEYCVPKTASSEINIDGKTFRTVKERMANPDRYTFDPAQNYIYDLMRKDPYSRFLKSKYFPDGTKKFSMDRNTRRHSRFLPLPLNAESMHLHGHHNYFESCAHNSLDLFKLHKSSSMDALTESKTAPPTTTCASNPNSSFVFEPSRAKAPLQRNPSGGALISTLQKDIPQMDEVDEITHIKQPVKSHSVQTSYPSQNSTKPKKVGGSFEELSLTQPISPNIRNFPRPKCSVAQLKIEEAKTKKIS